MPDKAGVYRFLNTAGNILYVGKAKNLKARVSSYFNNSDLLGDKTRVLVSQIAKIKITIVESELEALLLEAFYIKKYQPKYNIRLTDNKSYLRIRIVSKEKYPPVLLARREEDDNSIYFGPYPNSGALKTVLKTIRRIFPYVSVANHPKRICLYHHLGLCPCPQAFDRTSKPVILERSGNGAIESHQVLNGIPSRSLPLQDDKQLQTEYRKNIKGIIKILEGGSRQVMKDLEKQRDSFSKNEAFEKAAEMQKRINALSVITHPFHTPFEYDVNPNLRSDLRQQEIRQLMETLNDAGYDLKKLERIECYDISNIQGTHATGSMVVLTNGEIDKSQYRRFKIRRDWEKKSTKTAPNDFAMMKEVLKRRLRHEEWHWPDLLIVDGGKGQVSSALKAFEELGVTIPLIGLAKREETIVLPLSVIARHEVISSNSVIDTIKRRIAYDNEENFQEILLSKDSPALHLIMRIRDEAHRFAITYHRKLRSNYALKR